MTHSDTIKTVYEAFGRGDVAGILAHVTNDVDWDNSAVSSASCPWNGNFSGKTRLPEFFKAVAESLDITVFEPGTFVDSGSHVAVELRIESTVRKTGKPIKNTGMHLWTFDASGKISRYRHFNDTGAELAASKVG